MTRETFSSPNSLYIYIERNSLDTHFHISNCTSCSLSQLYFVTHLERKKERDMTQIMWLHFWWPKNTSPTTTKSGCEPGGTTIAATTTAGTITTAVANTAVSAACLARNASSSHCSCLAKLVKKLKRRSKGLRATTSRQSSFQCRYDPLSYSLNFDSTGCGSLLDEDYHHFYSFSSRFVANPRLTSCPRVLVATSH